MRFKGKIAWSIVLLLCILQSHAAKSIVEGQGDFLQVSKIFYTAQERRDLFVDLGVEYLNTTFIDYEHIFNVDPKLSEIYLRAPDYYDHLTVLYGADIAACTLTPMSVRWLGLEVGYGAFVEDDVAAGGFIGIYTGVVQDRRLIDNTDYAWLYPISTLEGTSISLSSREKGNELRFINDGQDPNCTAKYVIGFDNLWHICYVATKNIKKGEQLLVSYGSAYWNARKNKYQDLTKVEL